MEQIKSIINFFYNNAILLSIIFFIFIVVFYFVKRKNAITITHDTIITFTGTLGSGKTFNAVKYAIKTYKKYLRQWKWKKALSFKPLKTPKPILITNIPLKYKGKYTYILDVKQLLFERQIPYKSVVLIDEIGQVASQMDYTNAYVMEDLQKFIRFFRHVVDGRLILTDQCTANINLAIRRRIGTVYNLSNFRTILFGIFYICNCRKLEMSDDNVQNVNVMNNNDVPYLFGFVGKTFKNYDTRCYSILYENIQQLENVRQWSSMKTKEFIQLPFKKLDQYKKIKEWNRTDTKDGMS